MYDLSPSSLDVEKPKKKNRESSSSSSSSSKARTFSFLLYLWVLCISLSKRARVFLRHNFQKREEKTTKKREKSTSDTLNRTPGKNWSSVWTPQQRRHTKPPPLGRRRRRRRRNTPLLSLSPLVSLFGRSKDPRPSSW